MSLRVDFDHDAPRVAALLRRASAVVLEEADVGLARGAEEVARDMKARAPKALSTLTNAIIARRSAMLDYQVTAGVNYALAVEKGTGPGGSPPHGALLAWIKAKGIQSTSGASASGLAYLIGRSIRRKGTKAQPFAAPALEAMTPRVIELMREGIERGARKVGA